MSGGIRRSEWTRRLRPGGGRMARMPKPIETPSRAELIDHLVRTRIAGQVATPRENNLSHYRKLANGDRHYWLGLELGDRWTDEQDVLAVMAERCGVVDDPEFRYGGHHRPGADRGRPGPDGGAAAQGGARPAERAVRHRPPRTCWTSTGQQPGRDLRAAGCEIVVIPRGLTADEGSVWQFANMQVLERGATLAATRCTKATAAISWTA
ncbi:putative phosphatase [Streptomyces avidinii]